LKRRSSRTSRPRLSPRSPTHKAHPDSCRSEFDQGQIIGGVLLVAGCDGTEVLEFVEEAFDQIPATVEGGAEGQDIDPPGIRPDVCKGTTLSKRLSQGITIVGSICQEDLVLA